MQVVGDLMSKIITYTNTLKNNSNLVDFKVSQFTKTSEIDNWNRAKQLHIHLISGIVCRAMALDIFPEFERVSAYIYEKNWQKMIKEGRSPYFIENKISLGKRKGTCECRCRLEYIADEILYGGGVPKVRSNPYLGLRQEELSCYRNDGEEPEKTDFQSFRFSTIELNIEEA